jgi:hypothetical protein
MAKTKSKRSFRKLSRKNRKTRRTNKKGGIFNSLFRFKPIPDIRCRGNGKGILNRNEVEPFLDDLVKNSYNDSSLKNFFLNNCHVLDDALKKWKDPEQQKYFIEQFKLGPYIPGKRRLYTYLKKIKQFSSQTYKRQDDLSKVQSSQTQDGWRIGQ